MSPASDGVPIPDDVRVVTVHRMPPEPCPYCGKTLDADTGATPGARGPQPGDVGICFGCAEPLIYNEDLSRRRPTPAEAVELADSRLVQAAIARVRGAQS